MNNLDYEHVKKLDQDFCIGNYSRYPVLFVKGKGSFLYDDGGNEYLDLASGIGANSIGYSHPHWLDEITKQAGKIAHVSNLYYTEPYALLAERLVKASRMSRAFFCNSGAEANEAAIKLARKYSRDRYGDGRSTIITLEQSFHGRTLATIKATGQKGYHLDFAPYPDGFKYARPNDIKSLEEAMGKDVCAIMVEPVLGEGGVIPLDQTFVEKMDSLAKENDLLLIFDEIQTGIGRCGQIFSYMDFDIEPDIVSMAKGLGGGLPIGGILVNDKCSQTLTPGTHGTTFGGNPIACAGANAVLDVVLKEDFLEKVKKKGALLQDSLEKLESPLFKEVRGKGLMVGVEIAKIEAKSLVEELLQKGVVALTAGGNTLRLLPPLTISDDELMLGIQKIGQACSKLNQ